MKKAMPAGRQGFTIIELMVTVAIIAILAALIMVSFSNIKAKNRDAKRMGDLKSISNALNLYYSLHHSFLSTSGVPIHLDGTDTISSALVSEEFIPAPIIDPLDSGNYIYQYDSANGLDYTLSFCLETDSIQSYSPAGCYTIKP